MNCWELTCFYMGRASSENLRKSGLQDRMSLVEIGEDIGKLEGREFEDEDGPKLMTECPLDWKNGKASENWCGPWRMELDADVIPICDELLVRAGLPKLTVVMADGVPDLEATFDTEGCGVNYRQLYVLDLAEWHLRQLKGQELDDLNSMIPDLMHLTDL